MSWTKEELAAMAAADAEIEAGFSLTREEIESSRQRDRAAKIEALPYGKARSGRVWYEANRAKESARSRAWYLANREKVIAKHKAYNASHKAETAAYKRAWYEANRAERIAKCRAYHDTLRAAGPTEGMLTIRAARKRLGLSQAAFGALFGVGGSTVSRWETLKAPEYWRDIVRRAEETLCANGST